MFSDFVITAGAMRIFILIGIRIFKLEQSRFDKIRALLIVLLRCIAILFVITLVGRMLDRIVTHEGPGVAKAAVRDFLRDYSRALKHEGME